MITPSRPVTVAITPNMNSILNVDYFKTCYFKLNLLALLSWAHHTGVPRSIIVDEYLRYPHNHAADDENDGSIAER